MFRWSVGLLLLGATFLWADPIYPGYDLLHSGPGTQINLLGLGPTDPFHVDLTVPLVGDPLPGLGNTDTIVQRTGSVDDGATTPGIPIQIVALSLTSVAPITVDIGSGPQMWDVHVALSSTPSLGNIMITNHGDLGSDTFGAQFQVNWNVDFTPVGGGTTMQFMVPDTLIGTGAWDHAAPPLYPVDPSYPSGGFYITDPIFAGSIFALDVVPAQIPEPSAALLLGGGLAALLYLRRRRGAHLF